MGVSVKRIVVTGMGIVSPLGCGVQHVWQSLAGRVTVPGRAAGRVDIPCKVAGQVPSIDSDPLHGFDPLATIPAKERKKDGSLLLSLRWSPPVKRRPRPAGRQHLRPNRNVLPR